EPLIAARAKLNLQATGKNAASITNQGSANLPKLDPIYTRDELATMSGVSARNISKVKKWKPFPPLAGSPSRVSVSLHRL
ncbi:MAG: hypothetical protein ABTQ25_17020, partial [Nitrosomonas ureae]